MKSKVLLWVLVVVAVVAAGFLLFRPGSGANSGAQTGASTAGLGPQAVGHTIQTSGKPVFIEFYTDS